MVARHWRGWTLAEDADRYQNFLVREVLPRLRQIEGYRGGEILRRQDGDEVEFLVINFFDSIDSVRAFAGDDITRARFEPEALRLLCRYDFQATHYEVANPGSHCL